MTKINYYVARRNGTIERCADLANANAHATNLYRAGVVAAVVVAAVDETAAWDKANRCWNREITTGQARRP